MKSNFENINVQPSIREDVVPSRKKIKLPPWLEVAKPRLIPLLLATTLGVISLKTNLNEPLIIISHQIVASLMVAILSTLIFKKSSENILFNSTKSNVILSFN